MKRKIKLIAIITIILGWIPNLNAQDNNFLIEDGDIIWQKIYETNKPFEKISSFIKESGIIKSIELSENSKLTGEFSTLGADFKGAGFSEMSTPIYIARNYFSGFVIVEYKYKRYRVTIKNINLTQKYNDGLSAQGEVSALNTYAIKKNSTIKKMFLGSASQILDFTFSKLFEINESKNSNW